MKDKSFNKIYRIVLFSLIAFGIRYVQAITCYARGDNSYRNVCQLYFGGITIDNSFNIETISIYCILMLIIVVVINGSYLFELVSNDYMILCRAGSRKRLFKLITYRALKQNMIIIFINYLLYLAMEREPPAFNDALILYTEIGLSFTLFLISFSLIKVTGNKESYIIIFCVFLLFITLTGSIHYKASELPDWWNLSIFPYLIYNYSHPVISSYIYDGAAFEEASYKISCGSNLIHFECVTAIVIIAYLICKKIYCVRK